MKTFKKLFTAVGMVVLAFVMTFTVACGETTENKVKSDPEKRPLMMSISTPDGVFNPFFSTSAYDSTILGMTQVSMLSSDYLGNVTCGDNEPVVVKDYKIETYKSDEDGKEYTTYKFIIKNGMKFSDGEPLTIKDVLFNLYVYLDPVYTGSSTIYSTDIVGLSAYRTQQEDASDTYMSTFEQGFIDDANIRIQDLKDFMKVYGEFTATTENPKPSDKWANDAETKAARQKDYVTVAKAFREELYSDWNSVAGNMETYEKWKFTAPWQVFLLNDGGDTTLLATHQSGEYYGQYIKDADGNYELNKAYADELQEQLDEYLTNHNLSVNADSSKEEITAYEEGIREWAVNTVYFSYFSAAIDDKDNRFDYIETAFDKDHLEASIAKTSANSFASLVSYWMTADKVRDQFAAEEKSKYFAGITRNIPTIRGIEVLDKTTTDYSGKNLGEAHDVLGITINGVDPKAIWNFAFTVAPMHYYSGTYKGTDYVKEFDAEKGNFGVAYGDIDFMNNVINSPDKIGLPVGAGAYMASSANGGRAKSGSEFMNLNHIYYERNPYFESMGSGIHNAKIKHLQYFVVETDQVINSISTGEVDIGDPNATQQNIRTLNNAGIAHVEINTSGYGYIGVNPRFVPSIEVRRAIMKAMDTSIIINNYYQGGLAELIYRPMSTTSWAYPDGAKVYESKDGTSYEYDGTGYEIEDLVKSAGYEKNSAGVYEKNIPGFGIDTLDYEFTIAGTSTDHPAYNVFLKAQKLLNNHGFAVKVTTSQTALSDLSSGKLKVWAAAWSSTIDPDMYQVYHMDSLATSVNNWGYKQIKANKTLYSTEYGLITDLSELIDAGRSTTDTAERKSIYSAALDLVMELAVEMPTYQRKDMTAFNASIIDESTMTPKNRRSPYNGLLARIWELNYFI